MFFLVETSANMGQAGIDLLNSAIQQAIAKLKKLDEDKLDHLIHIAVFHFASNARLLTKGMVEVGELNPKDFTVGGDANFGLGCKLLNESLTDEILKGKKHWTNDSPIIFLLANGNFTGDWKNPLNELKQNKWFGRSLRYAFSLGDKANREILQEFVGTEHDWDHDHREEPQVFSYNDPAQIAEQIERCIERSRVTD